MKSTLAILLLGLLPLGAQEIKFPESFEKLAAKAKETVNVNLDGTMLQLAGNFLSGRKAEEAKVKQLAGNLKGIYVRTFEFAADGEYAEADLQPLRSQLVRERGWSRIVDVADQSERVEVYAKKDAERIVGMTVIAGEKRELTVVYVDGPIDLQQLGELVGTNLDRKLGATQKK